MKKKLTKIFGIGLAVMLLASLTLVSVPAGALTSATVVLSNTTISETGVTYTVTLSLGLELDEGEDITVVFPEDTDLTTTDDAVANVKMSATSGLGSAAFSDKDAGALDGATTAGTLVITVGDVNDDDKIGAGALIQLVIAGVVNAPALGDDYVLSISTDVETTAVDSQTFELTEPVISELPGVVVYKNTSGVPMDQTNVIQDAIDASQAGWTIEVGPGTYTEDITVDEAVTIMSTDGPVTTILAGTLLIQEEATFDGLTVEGAVTINTTADAVVQNCVLEAEVGVDIDATLTNNTYEVAAAAIGIDVADGQEATVSGGEFNVAATGTGIYSAGTLVLDDATMTGASGVGVEVEDTDESADITGCTFDGLTTAIVVTDAEAVSVSGCTITGCGDTATAAAAIVVTAVGGTGPVTIMENTIADCVDLILSVAANEDLVFMNFNAINNPAEGITSAAASVDCANNLWDGGTAPPVTSTNATTTPYLTAATSNATMATDGSAGLDAKTTVGVQVTTTNAVPVMVANYASNPGTGAVPGTATAYFDVYASGDPGDTTISLFGTVDANTVAYVWGAGLGEWVLCSDQAVNIFAGSVTLTVDATSIPTTDDLVGLPLALAQPAAAPPTVAATGLVPAMGADDVTVDPTFAWGAVTGAISYDFALAEDNPLAADPFDIIDYSAQTTINAHPAQQTLKYSTTYYWRVRAVTATETGPWTTGLFTTEAEPVEEEGGDIIVDVPDVTVDSPDITVQPAEVDITVEPAQPVIPDYLLWVIIAVGAVLVIALIVLIVRTRRTA